MKLTFVLLAAVLLATGALGASAYPTFDGATGVVNLPNAEIAPQGTFDLAATYVDTAFEWKGWPVARLNVGVTEDLEMSVGYAMWHDGDDDNILRGGLKYRFMTEEEKGADVAIGGSFAHEKYEDWSFFDKHITKAYLAVSDNFEMGEGSPLSCRGTLGVMYMRFAEDGWEDDFTRPYVALELAHNCGASLGLEYRWRANVEDDDDAPWAAVFRYEFPNTPLWIEAGLTNATYEGTSWGNERGFYGLGYTFGK